jgi:hypothetical protein
MSRGEEVKGKHSLKKLGKINFYCQKKNSKYLHFNDEFTLHHN